MKNEPDDKDEAIRCELCGRVVHLEETDPENPLLCIDCGSEKNSCGCADTDEP